MSEIRDKALKAQNKEAKYGPDININEYSSKAPQYPAQDLENIDIVDKERLLNAGVDITGNERSGSFIQVDSSVLHASPKQEGIEIMSMTDALDKYSWLEEYVWKIVPVETDKYTAHAELNFQGGYFVRSMPDAKTMFPVQACLYLKSEDVSQNVHNVIIAEEGSELHIITGCATDSPENRGLHVGVSEFYVKKNAKITFSMIHNWSKKVAVRPRSATRVEEGGVFINNYISMHPVESMQLYPSVYLVGKGATARLSSVLYAPPGTDMDVGAKAVLSAPDTRCEIIS
ncbi:MAG: SufD family Fe-S cluster assembly protein, partial [Actinobacteria bacterium]|nr:SufD family Fe-S cluster assembly protein [Actinomycetota bacterium]